MLAYKNIYNRILILVGVVKPLYVPKNEKVVDVLMKSLPNKKLVYFRSMLRMMDITNLVERRDEVP